MKKLGKFAEWILSIGKQDPRGHEIPDPKPMAIPAGFRRPETLQEQVRRLVQYERLVDDQDVESWDEANDFDIGDDFDPSSPWETIFDPELGREVTPQEFKEHWPQLKEEMATNLRNKYRLEAIEAAERRALENRGAGVSPAPRTPGEPLNRPSGQSVAAQENNNSQ